MVDIDGSHGEGGGQVMRTSLALSAITGTPFRLYAIRASRSNPGLAPQHLATVRAMAAICAADVRGAVLRSSTLEFRPQSPVVPGSYTFDVADSAQGGSAGAATLIFQALLLPLALAGGESRLTVRGGTHVPWSPGYHYLAHVFLPTVARMGLAVNLRLDAWGFYPAGGGQISGQIPGVRAQLAPLTITERGPLRRAWGLALAANLPSHIPQRIASRATNVLGQAGIKAQVTPLRERAASPGAALVLVAEYENAVSGYGSLGKLGKPSEQVAEEASFDLLANHNTGRPLDMHLADQILLPAALAAGQSTFSACRLTEHLATNAHIIQQFIPARITLDGPGIFTILGMPPAK